MLFNLLTSLIDQYSFLNVFKYLTFRTGLSVVTSLIVVFIIGGPLIKIFSEKIDVIFNSLAFEAINVSFSDVYKELINHHVLGIVNEEGRKYYLNFQKTTK